MRLLRTADGGFINTQRIVRLADERQQADTWIAVLADGEEVALAPYYSAPGRVKRELADIAVMPASVSIDCNSEVCCCGTDGP
jgi:hypothetical protein